MENKVILSTPRTKVECKDMSNNAYRTFDIKKVENDETLVTLNFQSGEIGTWGINGIMGEDLLEIVAERLRCFQQSSFACRENQLALEKIEEAIMWLDRRRKDRTLRGVEGTHKL